MILDDQIVFSWFALAALSTAYVAWDNFARRNPEMTVMKWGWVLITVYMGPLGLALYVLSDKEPRPGEHEAFVRPLWKQGIGSTVHCIAGDATGIVTAAAIVATLGLPMSVDLGVEYAAGFAFGLFIFQALFMKDMAGGSYLSAVRHSFVPEWLSMNMMAAGMFPVMTLLMMGRDMRAMEPTEPQFWFVMSLGVIVGFMAAYPVNVWLVAQGLKHGLMTMRSGGGGSGAAVGPVPDRPTPLAQAHHAQRVELSSPARTPISRRRVRAMSSTTTSGKHVMPQSSVTRPQLAVVSLLTVLALVAGVAYSANRVNLSLSAADVGGAIMPPGMVMTKDTSGQAMREMAAVDPEDVRSTAPANARGDRPLEPRLEGGVKVFGLDVSVIEWNILGYEQVKAYAFNGQVPGPRIRAKQGDRLRLEVSNNLPEATSVHWHGLILPNAMDGPAEITQDPIEPGQSFTYEFTAGQPGTYFYHSHREPDRQQALGMYGALVVDPADASVDRAYGYVHDVVLQLQEWLEREG